MTLDFLRGLAATDRPIGVDGATLIAAAFGGEAGAIEALGDPATKPMALQAFETLTRDAYGAALTEAGFLEEADRQLAQAAALSAQFMGLLDATIDAHKGDLYRRLWCFDDARLSYEKALTGVGGMPLLPLRDEWVQVGIFVQLAEIELLSGRLDEALKWNDKALAAVRPSNTKKEAAVLESRGEILLRASRFAAADAAFGDALKIAVEQGDVARQASTRSLRGGANMLRGRYGDAARDLETAVELYQKVGRPDSAALTWTALAEVYILLGVDSSARVSLEKARELAAESGFGLAQTLVEMVAARLSNGGTEDFGKWWELPETGGLMFEENVRLLIRDLVSADMPMPKPGGNASPPVHTSPPVVEALSHLLRGKLHAQRGELAAARDEWTKGLKTSPGDDLHAALLAGIGGTYWLQGNDRAAIRYLTDAVRAAELPLDNLKTEQVLAGYFGSHRQWYFEILIELLLRNGRVTEAFDLSERARARALQQMIGSTRLRPAGNQPALVAEAESLRTKIRLLRQQSALAAAGAGDDLTRARKEYEGVLARAKVASPEYAWLTQVEPLVLEEIRHALPQETTLISYFISSKRVHAWVLDAERLEHVSLDIDPAMLRRLACWAALLGRSNDAALTRGVNAPPRCGADLAVTAGQAYDTLVAPLRSRIHHPNLIFVPHGVLHTVPFAALRDRRTGRYLVEEYTISYAPSAGALRFLQEKESAMSGRALVIGDPAGETAAVQPLAGAEEEAAYVAGLFGTAPIIGADATENLLRDLDGRYDLVHIGAHASHEPASPLFSRIEMAPDANDPESDGNLEVHEILSDVDLTGVNLVVLSACSSAAGTRNAGDDAVGLTQAVLYAGAPAVISTLWSINDEAAETLMLALYRELRAGTPTAAALRKAQLQLLGSEEYRDPRRWAAFVLTGNPQGAWPAAAP
ncbi:MAG TPA: CHAT domain-containing tetratricopeptide repeat protein [Thermoanaerobaculia bacterium]